jgi:polysaccharide biosynthesis/export protein
MVKNSINANFAFRVTRGRSAKGVPSMGARIERAAIPLLIIVLTGVLHAQDPQSTASSMPSGSGATSLNSTINLPEEPIGANDLLGITVYDSPELTRTVRVDSDGTFRLPMVKEHIHAAGLLPEELEKVITAVLVHEQLFIDPIVSVSVVEYRSRPINIVGAVRTPITIQAAGDVTLLDAITQAGGLTDDAGSEILVSHRQAGPGGTTTEHIQHIDTQDLLDEVDPSLNIALQGGDVVRVPSAGRFYVVGNVKAPGVFTIRDGAQSSVLKAISLSQGVDSYTSHTAYVYRIVDGRGKREEIPIPLKKILDRKAPDMPLMANDILYIPVASGRKATLTALDRAAMIGAGFGSALIYIYH